VDLAMDPRDVGVQQMAFGGAAAAQEQRVAPESEDAPFVGTGQDVELFRHEALTTSNKDKVIPNSFALF
jgi:hypothetical protein